MISPSLETFLERFENQQTRLLPLSLTLHNDELTPVCVFKHFEARYEQAFMLESVENGEHQGRYTFLGFEPRAMISYQDGRFMVKHGSETRLDKQCQDPLSEMRSYMAKYTLKDTEGLPPFVGGAVGYVGYDLVRSVEDIPQSGRDDLAVPDLLFMVTDSVLVFDHLKHSLQIFCLAYLPEGCEPKQAYQQAVQKIEQIKQELKHIQLDQALPEIAEHDSEQPASLQSNISKDDFLKSVERCIEYIRAGDILQVVLSQRFSQKLSKPPVEIYRCLRAVNPSPYMFYFKFSKDFALAGSSPETMVRVQGTEILTKPIAGTRPRGKDPQDDLRLEQELLADQKELAEHTMLVDLGRNDIGRVAQAGSVDVRELMNVERYSHVMHIVSKVYGTLKPECDAYDAIKATFPAGTLSGAPKVRAMQIIDELEPSKRGTYGGLAGYLSFCGQMDTCITIRSVLMKEGMAYVQAGAGIVADSQPDKEYQESVNKAMAVLKSI